MAAQSLIISLLAFQTEQSVLPPFTLIAPINSEIEKL